MVSRKPQIVGKPFPRFEGELKVTGQAQYLDDIDFGPDLLYARLLRSPHPHALIKRIDASAARALPGVITVMTGRDVSGRLGLHLKDRPILANERVRYVGEPVAAVVAESPELAEEALALIRVTYTPLDFVEDVSEALAEDAPLVHPDSGDYPRANYVNLQPGANIAHFCRMEQGDIAQGFADADVVIEHTYEVQRCQHVSMEPHGCVAQVDDDGNCSLWASTQAPFTQREIICQALGLAPSALRVITPYVGGSFGGKRYVLIEAIAVALAYRCNGRPVKLVLSRPEDITTAFQRPGLRAQIKMGTDKEGSLIAIQATYYWNLGASADAALDILRATTYAGTGPYRVPNSLVESYGVYTNLPYASPMRGNGMAEIHWALEQHVDRMATAVGMTPLAFRLRNLIRGGDKLVGGETMHATGLHECVLKVAKALQRQSGSKAKSEASYARGRGLAVMWNPVMVASQQVAKATVRLDAENLCSVYISGVDFGQGVHTLAAQLVASELGVLVEWVRLMPFETKQGNRDALVASSHFTWSVGNALLDAARHAKQQVLQYVADRWQEPVGNLDIVEGAVVSYSTDRSLAIPRLLAGELAGQEEPVAPIFEGVGSFSVNDRDAEGAEGEDNLSLRYFSTGAQAVEVEVDRTTGIVRVTRVAAAFDVGHALNPDLVKAQIKGGLMQGLSTALLEQLKYEEGVPQRSTMREYKIATIQDLPRQVIPIIVEIPQEDGPFGARGIGEHSSIPVAPAVANAIYDAVGLRVDTLPISSEQIWSLLRAREYETNAC